MFEETWFDRFIETFGPIFIIGVGALIVGVILASIVAAIHQAIRNKQSPTLTRAAQVVAKRTHVWGSRTRSTSYFVTFELESGERVEFHVTDQQFGQLVEGDIGTLVSQGTALQAFDRVS